jgi:hypothetical protein
MSKDKNAVRDTTWDLVRLNAGEVVKVDGVKTFVTVLPGRMFHNECKGGGSVTYTAVVDRKILKYFKVLEDKGVETVRFAQELSNEMAAAIGSNRRDRVAMALAGVNSKSESLEFDLDDEANELEIVRQVPAEGDRPAYSIAKIYTELEADGENKSAIMTFKVADAIAAIGAKADYVHIEAFAWATPPAKPAAVAVVTTPADTL